MAYDQDKISVPQPSPSKENKFDGTGNPDKGEVAQVSLTLTPNQFPRQRGSDSLTEEEAYLS